MNLRLITYRTNGLKRHALVPDLFVSDLVNWLQLSDNTETLLFPELSDKTEVLSVSHNWTNFSDFVAPRDWPSYRSCEEYVQTVALIG